MKKMITRRNFLKAAGVSAAALGLAACGGSSSSTASSAASSTAASSTAAKADGKVYYLNFKPEQDQDWQDLAAEYTKETGVPVTVVTAASGQYETTLMSEMEKSEAPTLFQVNGPVGLANWKDYCYDLSGSQLYGELTSDSFALKDGDAVTSIAYVIETYGIIYNKELLTAAGYKQEDIKGFADLKKVADDIQARKAELGVDGAFTSAGMDGSSDWRFKTHLANLPIYYEYKADGIGSTDAIKGTYLDNYKQIWDLYITDSTCDPKLLASKTGNDAVAEFVGKKAVFYQNGTWAYNDVKDLATTTWVCCPSTSAWTARRIRACAPVPRTSGVSTTPLPRPTFRLLWISCTGVSPLRPAPAQWLTRWASSSPSRRLRTPPTP